MKQAIEQNEKIRMTLNDEISQWNAGFRNFQELRHTVNTGFHSIENQQKALRDSLQEAANRIDSLKLKIANEKIFGFVFGTIAASLIWLLITRVF